MKAKATVRLRFPSEKQLETVLNVLSPEANAPVNRRSKITFEKQGNCLALTIEAEDTVALRASLNAYLRWIGSTAKVLKVIEDS
jgi:tRNA threonylcarbamoyladenosine modification (KEOPS) complex  Pcc1 subunit